MKITLKKCDLCCYEHSTYDFFKEDDADYYIVSYEFRIGETKTATKYELMIKGHYRNGGIALVIGGQMVYTMGGNCFITGYCPIDIEKEK